MYSFGRFVVASIILVLVGTAPSSATCVPRNIGTPAPQDPVARALAAQSTCPKNTAEFTEALKQLGARMEPTMVNFAGFHNPDAGEFFIFEIVSRIWPRQRFDVSLPCGGDDGALSGKTPTGLDSGNRAANETDIVLFGPHFVCSDAA